MYAYEGFDQGDSFITNFDVNQLPLYKAVVAEWNSRYGEDALVIKEDAYDCLGNRVVYLNALHIFKGPKELSEFWYLHRKTELEPQFLVLRSQGWQKMIIQQSLSNTSRLHYSDAAFQEAAQKAKAWFNSQVDRSQQIQ